MKPARVVIVAEHASARFGGEAALPLHYFRVLRQRGADVWLVVHARTRAELQALFPGEPRIHYVEDSWFHLWMWRIGHWIPHRIDYFTAAFAMRLATQWSQRRIVQRLVAQEGIEVVHQPIPVSPREPTLMFGFGVPVVIGPMNGGMDFPPAFRKYEGRWVTSLLAIGRRASALLHYLMPGKRRSAVLLVANERTRRALPSGVGGKIVELTENGVDLSLWQPAEGARTAVGRVKLLFMGRLIELKGVDLLIEAFRTLVPGRPVQLTVVGEGSQRAPLESLCREAGLLAGDGDEPGKVFFAGWRTQQECALLLREADVLLLPSLRECGGAVVLEAMAAGLPVIATDWGGPADYLDESCGILVQPTSRAAMVTELAAAMSRLVESPELRASMGAAGRRKVLREFDWEVKVDRMLAIYRQAIDGA
jgi:glycosyltransferase involved in cell wall biosynthesis